jgi:hypothetical protein
MIWIEMASWLAAGVLLASLHVFLPKQRPENPWLTFALICVFALVGGFGFGMMRPAPFVVGGFSFGRLIGAFVVGELGAAMSNARPQRRWRI